MKHQADDELKSKAEQRDFKVIEYKLILDKPFHELID